MKLDCSRYLSVDNGYGILISQADALVLDQCKIVYLNCRSMSDLIMLLSNYIDDNYDGEFDDIEDVLSHLMENHYYNETKKQVF